MLKISYAAKNRQQAKDKPLKEKKDEDKYAKGTGKILNS